MGWLNELAKVAGSALGYYVGGPTGAAVGRGATGMLTGEETSNALENALYTGLGTYGVQTGLNALGGTELGADYPWLKELGGGGTTGGNILGLNMLGEGSNGGWNNNLSSMSGGSSVAPTAAKTASSGLSSYIPYMIAGGLVSDASTAETNKTKAAAEKTALEKYLTDTTWNDTTRANYMKGLMGQYSDLIEGSNQRIGATGADAGRGGGFYSSRSERAARDAREAVAKALSSTYQPSTTSPAVYTSLADANSAANTSSLSSILSSLGTTAGKWPYLALMSAN